MRLQGIKNQSSHSGMWKNVETGKSYEQEEVAGSNAWCPLQLVVVVGGGGGGVKNT